MNYLNRFGYNFFAHNCVKVNNYRIGYVDKLQKKKKTLIDYSEIDHQKFARPVRNRSVLDTIGYGVVLGFLWKLTGSLKYIDVQILQILLFSFLMFFVFYIALILFGNTKIAFYCGIAETLFFPIIFQNIQAHRDIWAYYGVILFLYASLKYFFNGLSLKALFIFLSLSGICQFIRPSVFSCFVAITFVFAIYGFFVNKMHKKKATLFLVVSIIANFLFFWVPFARFNLNSYEKIFVGPVGHGLLACLAQYPNKWGYVCSDGKINKIVTEKTSSHIELDNKKRSIFFKLIKEEPLYFASVVLRNNLKLLLPNLPWNHYPKKFESLSFKEKLIKSISSFDTFFIVILKSFYTFLFIILGYFGMFFVFLRKKYFVLALLLFGVMIGSRSFLHLDYRYVIPYYWVLSFFVGFLVFELENVLKKGFLKKVWA